MPVYSYQCQACKRKTDLFLHRVGDRDSPQSCPICSGRLIRDPVQGAKIQTWKPITLENVERTPKTFYTKQQLKDYCKKHGYESGALL